MKYGSVCSGVEAATVAWKGLGWTPAWFSQFDPEQDYSKGIDFPSKVLKYHYPDVENLGDMTKIYEKEKFKKESIDVLVGGTPCQSFSIAGLRGGLGEKRGNLSLEYCRILIAKQPRWFVWENVPGVYSSFSDEEESKIFYDGSYPGGNQGDYDCTQTADFATLLEGFRECGYSVAYRVFDSQYFGVPQRRRRVFVVGYLGDDWRPPAAVLFESESLRRDFTPSAEKGKEVTGTAATSFGKRGVDGDRIIDGAFAYHRMAAFGEYENDGTASSLKKRDHKDATDLILYSIMPMNSGKDYKARVVDISQPLMAGGPVGGNQGGDFLLQNKRIRRLTPLECELLQGFSGNYTNIPGASDSVRYQAMGNSMTTYVMKHIGKRIDMVNKIIENGI